MIFNSSIIKFVTGYDNMLKIKMAAIQIIRILLPNFLPFIDRLRTKLSKPHFSKLILKSCAKCTIYFPIEDNLIIGNNVQLNDAFLDLHSKIVIRNDVFFGHQVKVLTGYHDISLFGDDRRTAILKKDVIIEEGAWIASFSIILPGSHIGKHAVVAAGSVVHGYVEPYTVVAGSPAKVIKIINH